MRLFDSATGKAVSTRPKRFRALSSRVGVFPYKIGGKLLWQYRPEDEVFDDTSIESFYDAAITIGHPDDDLELSESHGSVYGVEPIKDSVDCEPGIYCDFLVYTEESRSLASSGIDVSPCYNAELHEKIGEFDGRKYDLIQKNIRYRSLGLVGDGRQETTRVYYQLSKDGNIFVNNNIIEVPEMATKLETIKPEPFKLDLSDSSQESSTETSEETTENTAESSETPEESTDSNETSETKEEPVKDSIAEINTEGGVNINRDYLDDAVDMAQRASSMGLLSFNEALQYSLSSLNTIKRMILLKDGIEVGEWEDISAAYKVYMKMKPLGNNSVVNSDRNITQNGLPNRAKTPIVPKINHPLHQKQQNKGYETVKVITFDDLE